MATLRSIQMQQHGTLQKYQRLPETARMFHLRRTRDRQIRDMLKKMAAAILEYCRTHQIKKIVVGRNKGWKTQVHLGKRTNQKFVQIPYQTFQRAIQDGCERAGIAYQETQESHTSKCSFLDNEPIGHQDRYCGKRIKRGLFRTATGDLINADANAAANIGVLGGWHGNRTSFHHALQSPQKIPLALS